MDHLFEFLGRLHPVLVHFPVVLLLAGAVFEAIRLRSSKPIWGDLAFWAFIFGTASALLTSGAGWILEDHSRHAPEEAELIEVHSSFAIAVLVAGTLACLAEYFWRNSEHTPRVWARRGIAWLTAALLVVAAHLGAQAVWGADWLS